MAGKTKNQVSSETLPLTVTPGLIALLEQITETHVYGKNSSETAAQILSQEVRRIVLSGDIEKLVTQRSLRIPEREQGDTGDGG